MIRESIIDGIDHDPDFEWRGRSVTRIENLSDIVFALALGMLVSASTAPTTYGDLLTFLLGIIPVSAGFTVMLTIWNAHFTYFRRYGLSDGRAIFLNSILLLLVLFIAYPLRFIFDSLFAYVLLTFGYFDRMVNMQLDFQRAGQIMLIYSVGYALVFVTLARLYSHALKRKNLLELSEREIRLTRVSIASYYLHVVVSLAVIAGVALTPIGPFSGFFFLLTSPVTMIVKAIIMRKEPKPIR